MANIIKPKRSNTASAVPTTGQLASGELAVNMADKKVYINNGTSVVQVGAGTLAALGDTSISSPTNGQSLIYNGTAWVNQTGAGSGDVVGPASATDNAIARYDGTTGKLIQNSIVSLDDNGNLQNLNGIAFDTTPTSAPTAVGAMYWDNGNGTPSVILDTDVELQLGQESLAKVYNGTGSTITKGSVIAVSGAQGQRPSVVLADADSEPLSAGTLGIAAEDIANGAEGFVCTFGLVRGINTSAFTAGAPIYLSQTAGAFTATRPSAPAHTVFLGWVISINASSGELFVNISNGWELDELHNVLISSPASGNTLVYDATAGVWKNANLTAGTGVSVTNGAGSISIANTGVTSLAGTANQVTASASTGAITLSLPATINVNTTGNAANVTGTVAIANGGTGATTNTAARTNLGATTIGSNLFTLTNPSAVTFPRFNADNTVSSLNAADFRTAIGAGTGNGTVTGVTATSPVASSGGTAPVISLSSAYGDTLNPYGSKTANQVLAAPNGSNGAPSFRALVQADIPDLTLEKIPDAWVKRSVRVATTANITLSGTQTIDGIAVVAGDRVLVKNQTTASQNGIYVVAAGSWARSADANTSAELAGAEVAVDSGTANGGLTFDTDFKSTDTLDTTAMSWFRCVDTNYFTTVGNNFATLTNPSAITFPRINADNSVSTLSAADFRTAIGAGTGNGTVTSITAGTGLSGGTITGSGTIALANTAVTAGSYTNANITVDAQGRITAASSGSGGSGTVTSVSGTGTVSGLTLTGTVTTSGSLTLGGNLSITADMIYNSFTATASQTTFTTTNTYTSGKIDVYANGVRMVNGADVTVTSGTSVVFASGLAVGTRVDLVYPI